MHPVWREDVDGGEAAVGGGQGYETSLYPPITFAVNLKLLIKCFYKNGFNSLGFLETLLMKRVTVSIVVKVFNERARQERAWPLGTLTRRGRAAGHSLIVQNHQDASAALQS